VTENARKILNKIYNKSEEFRAFEIEKNKINIPNIIALYKELQETLSPNQKVFVPDYVPNAPHIVLPMTRDGVHLLGGKIVPAEDYVKKSLSETDTSKINVFLDYLERAERDINKKLTGECTQKMLQS
jgi:hypothetical protein